MDSPALRIFLSVALILVPAMGFGIAKMPKEMGIALAAGVIAAIFVNLDRIAKFSGFGINAEMRDAIQEAYATTDALRKLARPLMVAAVDTLTFGNRWSGIPVEQRHKLLEEFDQLAGELNLRDFPELQQARRDFFRFGTWDQYMEFVRSLNDLKVDEDTTKRLIALRQYDTEKYPTREEVMEALGTFRQQLQPAQLARLDGYLFYRERRKLKPGTPQEED